MPTPHAHRPVPLGDTQPFTPSARRPLRVRARSLAADSHLEPHRHDWAQLAYCAAGILQVMVTGSARTTSFIVPPSRGVWIAPGQLHAITVLEAAELRTLYLHASVVPQDWDSARAIRITPLVRELIEALEPLNSSELHPAQPSRREKLLAQLLGDEIAQADSLALGVVLPPADGADKRLHSLCQRVLQHPGERTTLAQLARLVGASERTLARLFRQQLGLGYQQWRQQVALAHALPLIHLGQNISAVAAACGYSSDSAFTAMFTAALGQPPSHFRGARSGTPAARLRAPGAAAP